MTFLNPLALWGLLLIIIPIVIHLFNFRRVKKLLFSNVSFLTTVKSQSSSKNTLRKFLILILRILAIGFLVIAFAQPIIKENAELKSGGSAVYFLDNSLSMSRMSNSNNDLLADGIHLLRLLIEENLDDYSFGFITHEFSNYNRRIHSKELEDKLSEIELSNRSYGIETVVSKGDRISTEVNDFYIISDFQKGAFEGLPYLFEDSLKRFHLMKLRTNNSENLFVDSIVFENPIGLPAKNELKIRVHNIGNKDREDILIKLYKDERQVSSYTNNFDNNSMTWLTVDLSEIDISGQYSIEIEDNEFAYDNKFLFVIEKFSRANIYHIYEEHANGYVQSVYANEQYFDLQLNSISNVDQDRLLNADLIILDNFKRIPDWLNNQLANCKNSILVIPNRFVDQESYSSFFQSPVTLSSDSSKASVSKESLKHPFFSSVFNKNVVDSNLPWVKMNIELVIVSDAILKSSFGKPLFSEVREGVFVLMAPLSDEFTSLHKHGLFIPLMYKLSILHRENPTSYYSIQDRFIPLKNDSIFLEGNLKLVSSSEVIVPALRNIDGELSLEIPSVMEHPGFYELISESDTLRTLAFNLPKSESDIGSISDDDLRQMVEGRDNVEFESIEDISIISDRVASQKEGLPLWKYALLLALFFLISELTLLRIFR